MRKSKNPYFYQSVFNSFPVIPFAVCTYLSEIVSELYDAQSMRKSKNPYFYQSVFNSFPVIRTASAKNRRFHVPFIYSPTDFHDNRVK